MGANFRRRGRGTVEEFRVPGRCLHRLTDILTRVSCGLMADCEDF